MVTTTWNGCKYSNANHVVEDDEEQRTRWTVLRRLDLHGEGISKYDITTGR